jgi:hypothetical protein
MNVKRSLAVLCVAVAYSLIIDTPVLFAQDVVYACASTSTGAVRVVFAGSECKSNESPLQWNVAGQPGPTGPAGPAGPQGAPGEESVMTVGTSAVNTTRSVTVPVLGVVEVRCDASGVPNVALQLAAGSHVRTDETSVNGATQTTGSFRSGPSTFNLTTPDFSFGALATYWISLIGTDGVWKVDAHVRRFAAATPAPFPNPERPCMAAASITIMQ